MDMDEITRISRAIDVLQAQRETLGDVVVDASLEILRARLEEVRHSQGREEHKLVTLLFSDLVDSSRLSIHLDPEELRDILNRFLQSWADCIQENGGLVEKFIGDAVMAVFGMASAKEDDPQRAIIAALQMRQRLANLNKAFKQNYGIRLVMRTGIHTGNVVISTLDERRGQDFVVVGNSVNLASRLQAVAPQDGILISGDTQRLVQDLFLTSRQKPVRLKGFPEPVEVFEVIEETSRSAHIPRSRISAATLIGRQGELIKLKEAFLAARNRQIPSIITITGEPGIGKTRLLLEFENWLSTHHPETIRLKASALEQYSSSPYWIIRRAFVRWCGIMDSDSIEMAKFKFISRLDQHLHELGEMKAHWIGSLLGFDFSGSPYLRDVLEDIRQIHQRGIQYLGELLKTLAGDSALFILLDDIHFADDASLEAVLSMARGFPDLPMLVVCLSRQRLDEVHPEWGVTLSQTALIHHWIRLQPLNQAESRALLTQILHTSQSIDQAIERLVMETVGGNPYHLEEIVQMMIEESILKPGPDQGTWHLDEGRLSAWRVPTSLTAVIQARFDSLKTNERETLQRASVVGQVFWDRLLESLDGCPVPLEPALRALLHRSMITQQIQPAFTEYLEYRFCQPLLREVVYSMILKRKRRIWHKMIAIWLAQTVKITGREGEFAVPIAHHFAQAGEMNEAAEWLFRAGKRARQQGALEESRRFLNQALEMTEPENLDIRWRVTHELGFLLGEIGDLPARRENDKTILKLAQELGGDERLALAYRQISGTYQYSGDMPKALEALEFALAAARKANRLDLEVFLSAFKIATLAMTGKFEDAGKLVDQTLQQAEALGDDYELCRTLVNVALYYSLRGDLGLAVTMLQRQVELSRIMHLSIGETKGLINLGYCQMRLGLYEDACQTLEQAQSKCKTVNSLRDLAYARINLGLALQRSGKLEDSVQTLETAIDELQKEGDLFGQACGQSYLAETLEKNGQIERSIAQFEETIGMFEKQGMAAYAYASKAGLSRNLLAAGKKDLAESAALQVWGYLQKHGGSAMEYPVEAYLACTQVLSACGLTEQAQMALQQGFQELNAQAERISDLEWRKAFLVNVPAHRRLNDLFCKRG